MKEQDFNEDKRKRGMSDTNPQREVRGRAKPNENEEPYLLFSAGNVTVSARAKECTSAEEREKFLTLHQSGGWYETAAEQRAANTIAWTVEGMVISTCTTAGGQTLRIVTDTRFPTTCLMLSDEEAPRE